MAKPKFTSHVGMVDILPGKSIWNLCSYKKYFLLFKKPEHYESIRIQLKNKKP